MATRSGVAGMALLAALALILILPGRVTEAPRVDGEILLLLPTDAGPDAFTASVIRTGTPAAASPAPGGSTPSPPPAPTPEPSPSSRSALTGPLAVQGVLGSDRGLYAGTRHVSACDTQRLSSLLPPDAARTGAWADIVGVAPGDVGSYIAALTAVMLRDDTRVTGHGFSSSTAAATSHQAILAAGTPVLVDRFGAPRVRCASGAPLGAPLAQTAPPVYLGVRWPGFGTARLVAIEPARGPVDPIVLADANGGARFARPSGGDGSTDTDEPA